MRKFIKFSLLGGIGVLLYYITLFTLTELFGLWYLISAVIASGINTIVNFKIHKVKTFEAENIGNTQAQLLQYLIITILYYVTNTVLLFFLVQVCYIHYGISQILLTILLSIPAYLATKKNIQKKLGCTIKYQPSFYFAEMGGIFPSTKFLSSQKFV